MSIWMPGSNLGYMEFTFMNCGTKFSSSRHFTMVCFSEELWKLQSCTINSSSVLLTSVLLNVYCLLMFCFLWYMDPMSCKPIALFFACIVWYIKCQQILQRAQFSNPCSLCKKMNGDSKPCFCALSQILYFKPQENRVKISKNVLLFISVY